MSFTGLAGKARFGFFFFFFYNTVASAIVTTVKVIVFMNFSLLVLVWVIAVIQRQMQH